jgi:hypothetical protein
MSKQVLVIVKVSNSKFCKWHVKNLRKLESFLDKTYNGWRWYNVYDKDTHQQIANYTTKKRF